MSAEVTYILPEDVIIVPVTDLPETVLEQFAYESGDYAVTRPNSRTSTIIVNKDTASLLHYFRQPSTIGQAIVKYSRANALDPSTVLTTAYPIVARFIQSKLLLHENSPSAKVIGGTFRAGDVIGRYEVVNQIRAIDDSEVLLVKSESRQFGVLKIVSDRPSAKLTQTFQQEIAILQLLDNRFNPRLLDLGEFDDRIYLVTEWFYGINAGVIAGELRQSNQDIRKIIQLCQSILEAYAHLHGQGIVHGDVHPGNILVDSENTIKVIDYGLARTWEGAQGVARRGGIAFYYDPDYARALLEGLSPKQQTLSNEQYQLTAMLYYLIVGKHYFDFSVEKEKMLLQIIKESPQSFTDWGIVGLEPIESVINQGLQKDPNDRYRSLDEMLVAFKTAQSKVGAVSITTSKNFFNNSLVSSELLSLSILEGHWSREENIPSPRATINYGSAGIAYYYYCKALREGIANDLSLADIWINRAKADLGSYDALFNDKLGLNPQTIGHNSLYNGESGIHLIQSLISHAMGDFVSLKESLDEFIRCGSIETNQRDLTLGDAGIVLGCSLLYNDLKFKSVYLPELVAFGASAAESLLHRIEKFPAISNQSSALSYLGVAHGWAGILYALLSWYSVTDISPPRSIQDRIEELLRISEPVGRGIHWRQRINVQKSQYMPGWCNGTSGFMYLLTLAAKCFGEESYLLAATQAAWNVWEDGDELADLCCGLGGRAYSLLHLYKHTHDERWLDKATVLGNRAARNMLERTYGPENVANSLYKGKLGIALLLEEIDIPFKASMPLFELVSDSA
ncbi:MAG: hypothetical protein GFH25_541324n35 [Chloroflexi bacterium AL-N10]|nr:hypothetical protein [Chloroflexi bacterium AL-N10]